MIDSKLPSGVKRIACRPAQPALHRPGAASGRRCGARPLTFPWMFLKFCLFWMAWALAQPALAAGEGEYRVGAGDIIRISVFQNPELTTDARVGEKGAITFPLIGRVEIGGLALSEAERQIGERLRDGGFVVNPQVSIMLMQIRSSQVAVLGQVGRPGRYPLETTDTKLIDMLAIAGGIAPTGADVVVLNGYRAGKPISVEIDIPRLLLNAQFEQNIALQGGDILYVHRAPVFYIYGEIQRPGSYRLDRDMTVRHALALAGGITLRGTERGLRLHRRDENGKMIHLVEPNHDTLVRHDDVIFIRASLF